ncbi:hypothetical protein HZ326_26294 [Fusarium oxysporum f. sp. albedinis]|nr:hypothetical protein HZ326_26294 [Fusarium oxysporum f. sp. albedinis]
MWRLNKACVSYVNHIILFSGLFGRVIFHMIFVMVHRLHWLHSDQIPLIPMVVNKLKKKIPGWMRLKVFLGRGA